MKKTAAIFAIILMLLCFVFFKCRKDEAYKILEVLEGDKVYIDLNNNGKKDADELFHIKNINTFPFRYSKKAEYYSKRYNLTLEQIFYLGYLAKIYTTQKLSGKNVTFINKPDTYNPNYYYRFAEIKFENKDFAVMLLEEGLAFAYEGKGFNFYKAYEDIKKIHKNAESIKGQDVVILDKKYKIYHKAGCKNSVKIKDYDAILKTDLKKDFKPCKYCFNLNNKSLQTHLKASFDKISSNKTFKNVTIFLTNPLTYNEPSYFCRIDACKTLLKNINSAKTSIDFALYGIDRQDEVINALVLAQKRGVKIRGVVDIKPDGSFVYNDTKKLKQFEVVSDYKTPYMHNKFFIFDKQKVFTGTMNISMSGSGGYNANTSVLINDRKIAEIYLKEFNQMFNGRFQAQKEDYSVYDIPLNEDTKLSLIFSPKGNAYEKIISPLLKNAKKEIYVSIFYLTHNKIIEDLINAKKRGVDVKIIYDASGAMNMKEKVKFLRNSNVLTKAENWGGKDHEKNMEIDGMYFITGSANFSHSGMGKNDENILIFKNPKIAEFYRAHFLNLYNSIDNKYLKYIPRPESFESGKSCYDGIDNNFDGKIDGEDDGCKRYK